MRHVNQVGSASSHYSKVGLFNRKIVQRAEPVADSLRRATAGLSRQRLPLHPLTLLFVLSATNAPVWGRRDERPPAGTTDTPRPSSTGLLSDSFTSLHNVAEPGAYAGRSEYALPPLEGSVARAFPAVCAQRTARQAAQEGAQGSSFPLPGAAASPRNRQGAAPPRKPAQATGGNAKKRSGVSRAGAVRRVKSQRGESANERVHGNAASRNPAAMAGHAAASAGAAKESMQAPLKHPLGKDQAEPKQRPRETGDRPGAADVIRPAVPPPSTRTASGPTPGRSSPTDAAGPPPLAPAGPPHCTIIDDALVAFMLVRPGRYLPDLMNFCVDEPGDAPWLTSLFDAPADSKRGMGGWMASMLIEQSLPNSTNTLTVRRFGGKDIVRTGDAPQAEARRDQRYFSLLTLSLLDAPLRREAGNRALTMLQPNTFRLLSHPGMDDKPHLYLAYFLHRDTSACSGVKAGFVPVTATTGGQFSVVDAVHASSIVGTTLGALVATIEKFTGLRYCASAGTSSAAVTAEPATNLFVDIEQTRSQEDPQRHLEFNDRLDLFSPVSIDVDGRALPLSLYRNSFGWSEDRLYYADDKGNTGSLDFFRHRMSGDRQQLRCVVDRDCRFARQHGLHAGVFYRAEDIMERLEQGGLVWMPGQQPDQSTCSAQPNKIASDTGPSSRVLLPFEFSFRDGVLRYQDSDGPPGALRFTRTLTRPAPRYRLHGSGDGPESLFSARIGLEPGRNYSEDDIVWALTKEGYNHVGLES